MSLHKKDPFQQLEAVAAYQRQKARDRKELVDISWRLLQKGMINAFEYKKIAEANNQPTKSLF